MKIASIPYVYIVILNWNGCQRTAACLRSIQKLRYAHYRILVVDNQSTDDSICRLAQLFPQQDVITNRENFGYAGGNNPGIREALDAGADYVWLLNNDTLVEPDSLAAMVDIAEARPDVGAVGSVLYRMDRPDEVETWGGGRINLWLGLVNSPTRAIDERKLDYLSGASLLLRRETLDDVGLLDDRFFLYWEDADLGFRIRSAGWKLAVAPKSCLCHQGSASLGRKNALRDYYFAQSALRFFRKHATIAPVPMVVGMLARIVARFVRGEWHLCAATFRAIWEEIASPVKG
jgi:GT2 family glycosyltransferase